MMWGLRYSAENVKKLAKLESSQTLAVASGPKAHDGASQSLSLVLLQSTRSTVRAITFTLMLLDLCFGTIKV